MDSKFFASSKTGLKPASAKGTQLYGNKNNKKILKGAGLAAGIAAVVFLILFAVTYFVALRPTLALTSKVNEVKADISEISKSATNRDLVELSANLDKLEMDIAELRAARDENIGWMENFGLTKEYYADSNHFMDAGLQMIEAGREAIKLIEPFADAGGFRISAEQEIEIVDPAQGSGLAEAFSNWIAIMPEIAGDIDVVLNRLTLAGEELNKVDASKYPESFRGTDLRQSIIKAQNTLTLLNDSAPDIKEALNIIPPLLGVGTTEKRYMILMENDKELRATGGFWTYISTFKIANAQLSSDFTSQGTYNIDFALEVIDPYYTFPTVPDAYRNHLKVERMFSRDANISPDFPTSVDQFM
ncbi:MAG TPA: hypothetical protein PLF29_03520, partial [bacterium]|nr:hypothetical protein [bacterium]